MTPELLALENEAEQLKSEGKNEEAIAKLLQALEMDEKFARLHLALSVLYHKTEDYEKSVSHAERAVELEPDDAFNVAALSVTYQRALAETNNMEFMTAAEQARDRAHQLMAEQQQQQH